MIAFSSSGIWSATGLSIKDLHENLKALNVSTAGCFERQDLVDRLAAELEKRGEANSDESSMDTSGSRLLSNLLTVLSADNVIEWIPSC